MNAEEKRQRIRERLKMTQAEKWLTKKPQPKPIHTVKGECQFNEQLRGKSHPSYEGCW